MASRRGSGGVCSDSISRLAAFAAARMVLWILMHCIQVSIGAACQVLMLIEFLELNQQLLSGSDGE
jgi:hypothetical protein